LRNSMTMSDARRHTRLRKCFQVKLHQKVQSVLDVLLEGATVDLSQGGAFVKSEDWGFFKSHESMDLTFLLPPDFTGQDTTIGLQGSAIVRRVDRLREGIAVEFINELRQFRPTTML